MGEDRKVSTARVAAPKAGRPYGVLGERLGHTYTPVIYRELAGLEYVKFERKPEDVEAFIRGGGWEGVNVTIPYKKVVYGLVDELTPAARRLGNVNTVTRLEDGRLRGDNTDYYGFKTLVESLGLDLDGKKAVVFGGHGGAGTTAMAVLSDLGMSPVAISRKGEDTYEGLARHADAALAVNCTPAGMFPRCPDAPCTLEALDRLEGVVDIVYNPARTGLLMEAERRGIPHAGGLLMLVAQAAQAVERYTGEAIAPERALEVTRLLSATEQNVVLIGMPGAGKTRVGQNLAKLTGRAFVDIDHELESRLGAPCADFIRVNGEDAFRERETEALADVCARSGQVVSCGGGVVERERNYPLLHQNGFIVMLDRPLGELSSKGRPISARDGVGALAARRMPAYRAWADEVVASTDAPAHTAQAVLETLPPTL